ncbi:MAG: dipeptidase [Candidatus Zhuqueibacterota bacterium]
MTEKKLSDAEAIHRRATIVDLHAHASLKVSLFRRVLTVSIDASRSFNPFAMRTDFIKQRKGGIDVYLSTVYAPERGIYEECHFIKIMKYLMPLTWRKIYGQSYFDAATMMLDEMEKAVQKAKDPVTGAAVAQVVRSVDELDALLARPEAGRPIAVIHNLEGAHCLDGRVDHLDDFFTRGVAYLTLAHFYANDAANPCFPYPESIQKFGCYRGSRDLSLGLGKIGEQVVERMVELGMIIDITHCTPPARRRVYDIVAGRAPVFASHIGAYEVNPNPYNLKDWEIKTIADAGGVVGVIFMNYWLMPHVTRRGLDFITKTINHIIRIGGVDSAAIGSDFDGFTDPPDDLKDAAGMLNLTQRLLAEQYSEEQINKILGENALRMIRQGWGKRR